MPNCIAIKTPDVTVEEQSALQAVYQGVADEHQQRLALYVIINKFSRVHDLAYVPGSFDESAFLSGRGFVGAKILKYINLPIGKLEEETSNVHT